MLALKYLLMILGIGLFGSAGALVAYDVFLATELRRLLGGRRALSLGSEAAGFHPHEFATTRGRASGGSGRFHHLPPTRAQLHDARNLCHETGRTAQQSS